MRTSFLSSSIVSALALTTGVMAQAPKGPGEPMIGDLPLSEVASSTLQVSNNKPFVGEIFTVTHQTSVMRRAFQGLADGFDWTVGGLNLEDWSNPVSSEGRINGEPRIVNTQTAKAYSRNPGQLTLPGTYQAVNLITSTTRTDLTTQTNSDKFNLRTPPPKIEVKPLPEPTPITFMGAVGDFNLTSKVASAKVAVGESVTWSLELTGAGNWPEIHGMPARSVSKDFTVVKPVTKIELKPGQLFDGKLTEDVLLVPTKNGTYQLGPIRYTYFDPKSGKYQMITTETIMLVVGTGGPVVNGGSTTDVSADPAAAGGSVKSAAVGRSVVPEAPPPIPLEPLSGLSSGFAPFTWEVLKVLAIIPVVLVFGYWLVLAARRRRLTDPHRPRREARDAMTAALSKLDDPNNVAPAPETIREQIYRWQQATARYWEIPRPVPKPKELTKAIEKLANPTAAATWLELWRESEKTLHGKSGMLISTWSKRAQKALHAAPLADPPFVAIFFPRNLLPMAAAALVLGLALLPHSLRADAATDAYTKGDFAGAEKIWSDAVAKSPRDSVARYNLSLAQAQQDRWAEAATQALAAFCLNPGNDAIRWQFKLALNRSGIDQPLITALANRDAFFKIVGLFSPGMWGLLLDFSSVLFAVALGTLLWAAYQHRPSRLCWIAGVVTVFAILLCISAALSIKRYGLLADRSIAVVSRTTSLRSVPTEVNSTQKTSPLPAGSLAAVDRAFLGWSHLVFPNGQTGWVRTEMVTHLYQ